MDLHQFFDARTAALLEKAIEQHPEFARAIHHRVVLKRDIPDRYVGIGRTEHGFAEQTSGQYNREINGTPLPQVTQPPKPPKPPKPDKPKPEPKPRGQVRPPMQKIKDVKPPAPKPEPAPKPPARIKHPAIRIDTLTHNDLTYITLKEARALVHDTPLQKLSIYRSGVAFGHYSDRTPIIRRIQIGVNIMHPTILYERTDCERIITARLADIEPKTLPKHENHVIYMERVAYAGFEWMKISEALAILAGVTVHDIHEAWTNASRRQQFKQYLYQWLYREISRQRIPSLRIGENKGSFVRTIDIIPLAGSKADVLL